MTGLVDTVVTGVCTGLGTGVGSYLATRYAISHIKKLEDRFRPGGNDEKQ